MPAPSRYCQAFQQFGRIKSQPLCFLKQSRNVRCRTQFFSQSRRFHTGLNVPQFTLSVNLGPEMFPRFLSIADRRARQQTKGAPDRGAPNTHG